MAKLTKKQQAQINDIEHDLARALDWLMSERIEVCGVGDVTTLAYRNRDGRTLLPLEKRIGSPLQYLENAQRKLRRLGTPPINLDEHVQRNQPHG